MKHTEYEAQYNEVCQYYDGYKSKKKKKNHMDETDGAKYREQALNFLILSTHATLPNLHMLTNPEVI